MHLLWGILKQENSVGAQVMRQLGVSLSGLEAALQRDGQPVDNQDFRRKLSRLWSFPAPRLNAWV